MAKVQYDCSEDGIGKIVLNDPDNLNAMGEEMADDFAALVDRLQSEFALPRVIIITGAGRAFSAGGNLQMLQKKTELSKDENRQRMMKFYHSFLVIRKLSVPLIAAINGHAIGAGLCVACACDIRVVAEEAKLGFTFTKLGLHPGMGATYFLPRLVGIARAIELMATGRVIKGSDAAEYNLASTVVPSAQVVDAALQIAAEVKQCGPLSVAQLLESLRGRADELEAHLMREAECQSVNYASDEFKEGVVAAIEKRAAKF